MKRYLTLLQGILFLCLLVFPCSAQSPLSVSLGNGNGFAGDRVTITVAADSNPGFSLLRLKLAYDTSALTCIGISGDVPCDVQYSSSSHTLLWQTIEDDFSAPGSLVSLTFQIANSAVPGTYPVGISFSECYSSSEEAVSVSVTEGLVTVQSPAIAVTDIRLSPESFLLTSEGDSFPLSVSLTPADATDASLTFSSSNSGIASVSPEGLVSAVSSGTAIITVKSNSSGLKASCTVTVRVPHIHDYRMITGTATQHIKICDCGDILEKADHQFGLYATMEEPTDSSSGVEARECLICGYLDTRELPALSTSPHISTDAESSAPLAPPEISGKEQEESNTAPTPLDGSEPDSAAPSAEPFSASDAAEASQKASSVNKAGPSAFSYALIGGFVVILASALFLIIRKHLKR